MRVGLRGRERIRTAVQGFADLCLATRPRDQNQSAKIINWISWNGFIYALLRVILTEKSPR